MYTPAVTMVAAWMSAETGVGPAIASGNHTYNGIWADLPVAPMKKHKVTHVAQFWPKKPVSSKGERSARSSGIANGMVGLEAYSQNSR